MVGHGAKFGQKMEQAIAALLSHSSVEAAARAVGISVNTLLRWMKEPEFEAAYREARRTTVSQSMARMQEASIAAAVTVLKIMLDSNAPAGTRLRAAEIVLEQAARATEIDYVEARLAKLERRVAPIKTRRTPSANLALPSPTPAQISAPRLGNSENDIE